MKFAFSITFFIFFQSSFAQIDIISENVNHPDSNVLYIGVDNQLKLKGASINSYALSADGSQISKLDDRFLVRVLSPGSTVLKLYHNKKTILSKPFRIETISLPKAQLGAIIDTVAKVSEILANPFLHVVFPNSAYKCHYDILQFELNIIKSINDTVSNALYSNNFELQKSQFDIVRELVSGDRLAFHNIRVACTSCRTTKLPQLTIAIE